MIFQDPSNKEILGFIPAVIFSGLISGVVGAGIALFGTHLQNKSNAIRQKELLEEQSRQQKERLEHEAEQRKLEREMILRRDIYLSGIEAVGKMQQFILSFSNVNQPTEARENIINGVAESLNKVSIIANLETIKALDVLDSYYKNSLPLLMEKRMELDNDIQYKINTEIYVQNSIQRNQQLINLYNNPNNVLTNEQRIAINEEFQKNHNEIEESQKLIEELKHKTIDRIIELLNLCFQRANEFQKLCIDAILCVRRELSFPIDEVQYETLIKQSYQKSIEHITQWFETLVEKHRHEL